MHLSLACIQMNCQNDMDANIRQASAYIKDAAAQGAKFVALPENAVFMSAGGEDLLANSYLQEEHPALPVFMELARSLDIWLLVGSLIVKVPHTHKLANRSLLLNPEGKIAAQYDKIHLYDVSVKDGETHQESKRIEAGNKAIVADTPWGKLGMTVCYDVRFPHLYRSLAKKGAQIITVPAAFTRYTGERHWHTLLRARAIENGCFIIAPAQTGSHPLGRLTYGHSLVIDPWGQVLMDAGETPGVTLCRIDMATVQQMRQQIPSLEHDRAFD